MTKLQRWKADHFLGSRMAQGWAAGVTRRCSRGGSAPPRHGERRAWRGACAHASRHCGFPALAAASQGHTRPSRGTGDRHAAVAGGGGPARGRLGGQGVRHTAMGGRGAGTRDLSVLSLQLSVMLQLVQNLKFKKSYFA